MTHNFLEFFALSRGYGISMAILAGGVWFSIRVLQTNKTRYYIYTLICMILSVSANLTIMNSFIILTGLLILKVIYSYRENIGKTIKLSGIIIFLGIIPVILFILLLFRLKAEGELYYGKPDGFWQITVNTVVKLLTGSEASVFRYFVLFYFVLVCVIFLIQILSHYRQKKAGIIFQPEWLFFYLLTGNVIASILENRIFSVNYPEDRTGLHFYLFLIGSVFFLLDKLKVKLKLIIWLSFLPLIFIPVHFFIHLNLSYSSLENQNIPLRFYQKVKNDRIPGQPPPTIEGYQTRVMRWAYHNFREKGELSSIHYSNYPCLDADFQIVHINDFPEWQQYYDSIDYDPNSEFFLLKRKNKLSKSLIYKNENFTEVKTFDNEYFNIAKGMVDTLINSTLYLSYNLKLCTGKRPFHSWIVTTVYDKNHKTLRYEYIALDWFRTEWNCNDKPFINGMLIYNLPVDAYSYITYIWNIQKVPFQINKCEFSMFKLQKDYP